MWSRLPAEKPVRPQVTRAAIIEAAIALADSEGLSAVSIRRVAAALDMRPMRLYTHIERKDDLVDLMVDTVIAECLVDDLPADWRGALTAIARQTRALCLRHPWIIGGIERREYMGPNAVRHLEQSLAAIADLPVDHDRARSILMAVDSFTLGHLAITAVRRDGQTGPPGWERSALGYVDELIATGEFPHLAQAGSKHALPGDNEDRVFEAGLEWLLAGIDASLRLTR